MQGNTSQIEELLEQILIWIRVGMYPTVDQVLRTQFAGEKVRPEEVLAYELLDGSRSQKDVLELCQRSLSEAKISRSALSSWVARWEKLGLVKKEGSSAKRLFSLQDFGLPVPVVKEASPHTGAAGSEGETE